MKTANLTRHTVLWTIWHNSTKPLARMTAGEIVDQLAHYAMINAARRGGMATEVEVVATPEDGEGMPWLLVRNNRQGSHPAYRVLDSFSSEEDALAAEFQWNWTRYYVEGDQHPAIYDTWEECREALYERRIAINY